jgi:hypothetical protein
MRLDAPVEEGIDSFFFVGMVGGSRIMSWRDNAPEPVQADLDGLLDSAISLAEKKLSERGEFFPFGMAVDTGGGMRMVEAGAGLRRRRGR